MEQIDITAFKQHLFNLLLAIDVHHKFEYEDEVRVIDSLINYLGVVQLNDSLDVDHLIKTSPTQFALYLQALSTLLNAMHPIMNKLHSSTLDSVSYINTLHQQLLKKWNDFQIDRLGL